MLKSIFALCLLLITPLTGYASDFVEIINSPNYIIEIDVESYRYRDDYVTVWIKATLKNDNQKKISQKLNKEVGYILYHDAYLRNELKVKHLNTCIYSTDGELIYNKANPIEKSKWEDIIPGSVGETIYELVTLKK